MIDLSHGELTDVFSVPALDVEGVVAESVDGCGVVEHETVGTELQHSHVVHALVVQVALLRIGEEPVLLRAPEVGGKLCKQR